jgi:uncharacterized protein (DUF488 family)
VSTVYTVGHSTRPATELVGLLGEVGVELLVDVRRWPASKRNPQFGRDALEETLSEAGIAYRHLEVLGGFRDPVSDSPNGGWQNDGFRGYADHLQAGGAREAVETLAREAGERRLAVMCAERVPWRCHRQILADWFVAAGLEVRHLLEEDRSEAHELREMARITGDGRVVYPAQAPGAEAAGRGPEQGELFEEEAEDDGGH